jgi:triacylglycerol lipase
MGTHGLFWLLNDELGPDWRQQIDMNDPLFQGNKKSNSQVQDSLGFELSKRGFDVWIGNQRGNRFCQKHTVLNPKKDSSFWNFSLDEIALFDLPAIIQFIMKNTNHSCLTYIGFSQGASAMLALLSTQTKYNDVIKPCVLIAPVTKTTHSKFVTGFGNTIIKWAPSIATRFPGLMYPPFLEFLIQLFFCNHSLESLSNTIGKSFYSGKHVNSKRVSTFLAFPGVHASRKNAVQYLQYVSGPFARFDYGKTKNMQVYRSKYPPEYDVSKITNEHLCVIYSQDDTCAADQDVRFMMNQLTVSPLDVYVVRKKKWDHQDFQLGKDCGKVVNERIVLLLKIVLGEKKSISEGVSKEDIFHSIGNRSGCPSTPDNFLSLDENQKNCSLSDSNSFEDVKVRSASHSSATSSSNASSFELVNDGQEEGVTSTTQEETNDDKLGKESSLRRRR